MLLYQRVTNKKMGLYKICSADNGRLNCLTLLNRLQNGFYMVLTTTYGDNVVSSMVTTMITGHGMGSYMTLPSKGDMNEYTELLWFMFQTQQIIIPNLTRHGWDLQHTQYSN